VKSQNSFTVLLTYSKAWRHQLKQDANNGSQQPVKLALLHDYNFIQAVIKTHTSKML